VIDVPSILSIIRKAAALECAESGIDHGHVAQTEHLKLQKSGQFPDEPVRITV
jgi:hypothetical protein